MLYWAINRLMTFLRLFGLSLVLISLVGLWADDSQEKPEKPNHEHPWTLYSATHEQRLSRQRLRLPSAEQVLDMHSEFVKILNEEFQFLYQANRKLFIADVRRGLIGVYKDKDGTIKSYRHLYDAKLYSNYNPDAANSTTEVTKENPGFRTHERITARLLNSDIPLSLTPNESPTKQRLVIGKYSSGASWVTRTGKSLECPVIFLKSNLNVNQQLHIRAFEKSLRRFLATIQINDNQRSLVLTVDSSNQVEAGLYVPQIKPIKPLEEGLINFDYFKTWLRAKYVRTDSPHIRLAMLSALIQFGSAVALTMIFKPNDFHIVPAFANGLFALVICSHSKTYEHIVKSGSFLWEAFKRLVIAAPIGMVIAGINHPPDHFSAFADPQTWYQVIVISYLDRIASTFMNKIPRWRDSIGLSAGTFKLKIFGKTFDTGLPGDSTEREIPAIIRNIPKFIGYLLAAGNSWIPSGTMALLMTIPPAELVNYLWVKKHQNTHPKLALEYQKQMSGLNFSQKLNATKARFNEFTYDLLISLNELSHPETLGDSLRTKFESSRRRCSYWLKSFLGKT